MSGSDKERSEEILDSEELEIEPAEPSEPPKVKSLLTELLEHAKSEVAQEKMKLEEEFRRKEEVERKRREEEEAQKREEYWRKVEEERRKREEQIRAHEERKRQKELEEQIRREIEAEERKKQAAGRKRLPTLVFPVAAIVVLGIAAGIYGLTGKESTPVTFGLGALKEEGLNPALSPEPLQLASYRHVDKQMMIPPDVLIVNIDPQKITYHKPSEIKKGSGKRVSKTEEPKGVQIKIKTGIFDTKKVIK